MTWIGKYLIYIISLNKLLEIYIFTCPQDFYDFFVIPADLLRQTLREKRAEKNVCECFFKISYFIIIACHAFVPQYHIYDMLISF